MPQAYAHFSSGRHTRYLGYKGLKKPLVAAAPKELRGKRLF